MRAVVLVLPLLLSGCFFFDHCDYREPVVHFEASGAWQAIHNETPQGWLLGQAPESPIPFAPVGLADRLGHYGLTHIEGPPTGLAVPEGGRIHDYDPPGRLSMTQGPWVSIIVAESVSAADVRPHALRFVENVSALPEAQRIAWVDEVLLDERELMLSMYDGESWYNHTGFSGELQGPLRLEALWDELEMQPGPIGRDTSVAEVQGWSFTIRVYAWELHRGEERFSIAYDGSGSYAGDWPQEDIGAEAALPDYEAAYASLGLGPTPEGEYGFEGAIC